MADATTHSKVTFNESNIARADYTADYTATLPKLPLTGDAVRFRAHFKGNNSTMNMTVGSSLIGGSSIVSGSSVIWDVTIINIGSGDFKVTATATQSGSTVNQIAVEDTITELMATTNVSVTWSNTSASDRYVIVNI